MMRTNWLPSVLAAVAVNVSATPADTYFALAVTGNSHNHYGHNRLFLDFQDQMDTGKVSPEVVIAPRVTNDAIKLDGDIGEWNAAQFSTVKGRVMNNYPLSEYYDAVPGDIRVAAAHDDQYIYFAVQWEDANHDASVNRNRWHFNGQKWFKQSHVKPNKGAPTARAVNRDDELEGLESEDRLLMMFPIIDQQQNFKNGGFGCAAYCHANLYANDAADRAVIGSGVAVMHTTMEGDLADLWHWTSTRSMPMNTLKDAHLVYSAEEQGNGRVADDGQAPDLSNDEKKLELGVESRPAYVSKSEYEAGLYAKPGHRTERLTKDDLLRITPDMQLAKGVSLPYSISQPSNGSRADVDVVASFDDNSKQWTLELRRKLQTGDKFDRQFVAGKDAYPPTTAPLIPGDAARGEQLYKDKSCYTCHGNHGEGVYKDGEWQYPRNQRASGALIAKTASINRLKRTRNLAYSAEKEKREPPKHLMVHIRLTQQEAEDIAAWLQTQYLPHHRDPAKERRPAPGHEHHDH